MNAVNKKGESALIIACRCTSFEHHLSTHFYIAAEVNMQDNDGCMVCFDESVSITLISVVLLIVC